MRALLEGLIESDMSSSNKLETLVCCVLLWLVSEKIISQEQSRSCWFCLFPEVHPPVG